MDTKLKQVHLNSNSYLRNRQMETKQKRCSLNLGLLHSQIVDESRSSAFHDSYSRLSFKLYGRLNQRRSFKNSWVWVLYTTPLYGLVCTIFTYLKIGFQKLSFSYFGSIKSIQKTISVSSFSRYIIICKLTLCKVFVVILFWKLRDVFNFKC